VRVFRSIPEDLDELHGQRISDALEAKGPKLAGAWLRNAKSGMTARVICLVETEVQLDIWLIKDRNAIFADLSDPGPLKGSP
jgi:hypothetical protein